VHLLNPSFKKMSLEKVFKLKTQIMQNYRTTKNTAKVRKDGIRQNLTL
jgi:hypothetical protein